MAHHDLPRAIRLVESNSISLADLVTERHSLDEWPDAFSALSSRRGLKVVIEPNP
jgi:threonine dehydrogenase-like Zn-dependent dehydrogenase